MKENEKRGVETSLYTVQAGEGLRRAVADLGVGDPGDEEAEKIIAAAELKRATDPKGRGTPGGGEIGH